jgi:hypothetical protein
VYQYRDIFCISDICIHKPIIAIALDILDKMSCKIQKSEYAYISILFFFLSLLMKKLLLVSLSLLLTVGVLTTPAFASNNDGEDGYKFGK